MKITILSKKYGSQVINTDTFQAHKASSKSTAFQIIEHIFNDWYDHNTQPGAPMGTDIQGMYYGEGDQPAIYTRSGAIRQGIEIMIDEATETNRTLITTKDIIKMDIEAAFD